MNRQWKIYNYEQTMENTLIGIDNGKENDNNQRMEMEMRIIRIDNRKENDKNR